MRCDGLGVTYIEGKVRGLSGEEIVRFLIDSGATYMVLPEDVWRKIGLKPIRGHRFILTDGTSSTLRFESSSARNRHSSASFSAIGPEAN